MAPILAHVCLPGSHIAERSYLTISTCHLEISQPDPQVHFLSSKLQTTGNILSIVELRVTPFFHQLQHFFFKCLCRLHYHFAILLTFADKFFDTFPFSVHCLVPKLMPHGLGLCTAVCPSLFLDSNFCFSQLLLHNKQPQNYWLEKNTILFAHRSVVQQFGLGSAGLFFYQS